MNRVRLLITGAMVLCGLAWAYAQEQDPVATQKAAVPESSNHITPQPAAPAGLAEQNKGRGKLFVKEATFDYGFVAQDVKISHEFILENVGKDTLFIERIKPT